MLTKQLAHKVPEEGAEQLGDKPENMLLVPGTTLQWRMHLNQDTETTHSRRKSNKPCPKLKSYLQ
jgi:hypothetical protein